MNTLEPAQMKDIEICCAIIDDGRQFQRAQGFVQWTDDYPNMDTIRSDIQSSKGYVFRTDDKIAGYMCIDFNGEPAYEEISGEWRTKKPYAVIHRMAFGRAFTGMGLADAAFGLIEELCIRNGIHDIRIDTDFPNKRMQHILKKNGFVNCGVVTLRGNEKRLAFDKLL